MLWIKFLPYFKVGYSLCAYGRAAGSPVLTVKYFGLARTKQSDILGLACCVSLVVTCERLC